MASQTGKKEKKKNTPMTHAGEGEKQPKKREGRLSQKEKKEKKEMASNKTKQQQQQQQQLVPVVFWSSPYQAQEVVNHWTKHFPRKT